MSIYPDSVEPPLTLGWRLRMALEHADMTGDQMAELLGIKSRDTMAAWTHDRRRPKAAYLRQWALRTRVSYEWLIGHDENGPDGSELPVSGSRWNHAATPLRAVAAAA